mmetsp:Transcript_13259/g.36633  ORF Transcript_13259/g.36633 Transcript_13259/m.36633 type:complete len:87 (-) Transcript_13259:409-669(-)
METVVQLEPLSPDERTRNIDSLQRIYAEHIPRLEDILGLCASADVMALDVRFSIFFSFLLFMHVEIACDSYNDNILSFHLTQVLRA